jgi:hypothetical protein
MKNLLVIRAGDRSLHPKYLTARNFDVAISYFGDQPDRYRDDAIFYEQAKGGKWDCLDRFCSSHAEQISEYDFIGFPDDDLDTDAETWNRVFQIGSDFELDLFQPALTIDSPAFWDFVHTEPDKVLRYVNFVEIMTPIFSKRAFKICSPTLGLSGPFGRGLDQLWPQILPWPLYRRAIIDSEPVKHTQAVGGELHQRFAEMHDEANLKAEKLLQHYRITWQEFKTLGFVPKWN